jgi:hypothetical protein
MDPHELDDIQIPTDSNDDHHQTNGKLFIWIPLDSWEVYWNVKKYFTSDFYFV